MSVRCWTEPLVEVVEVTSSMSQRAQIVSAGFEAPTAIQPDSWRWLCDRVAGNCPSSLRDTWADSDR